MPQELPSICNMITLTNYGDSNWLRTNGFHTLNKLLDQMSTTKLARPFMMLPTMAWMPTQWTERKMVNTLKLVNQEMVGDKMVHQMTTTTPT